ncbi:MAG: hypothetical protein AB1589_43655, partial [Cyanobacteriota bacterium]
IDEFAYAIRKIGARVEVMRSCRTAEEWEQQFQRYKERSVFYDFVENLYRYQTRYELYEQSLLDELGKLINELGIEVLPTRRFERELRQLESSCLCGVKDLEVETRGFADTDRIRHKLSLLACAQAISVTKDELPIIWTFHKGLIEYETHCFKNRYFSADSFLLDVFLEPDAIFDLGMVNSVIELMEKYSRVPPLDVSTEVLKERARLLYKHLLLREPPDIVFQRSDLVRASVLSQFGEYRARREERDQREPSHDDLDYIFQ